MKLKKYVGNTMPEIMKKIRTDLGPDAVILNTKEVQHGGFFGFFTKKKLEVVAALDPDPIHPQKRKEVTIPKTDDLVVRENNNPVLQEIQQLKQMIHKQFKSEMRYSPEYNVVYEYLLEQEVEKTLASKLLEEVIFQHEQNEISPNIENIINDLEKQIENFISKRVTKHKEIKAKVIHFVGPTGVGKTTTLAKVAANSILQNKKKVAFITADTYRIAAIDQLKTYAQILNVPLEVAYTKQDYEKALKQFSSYDLIYVDTAGRNFRDKSYIKELEEMIAINEKAHSYLVLSLTAKQNDIIDIFNKFKSLNIQDIIFTKIDETRQYGNILNLISHDDVNIAYLTNGQDVPNDLLIPSPKIISDLIIGDYFNE